jgi:hypothetical protein
MVVVCSLMDTEVATPMATISMSKTREAILKKSPIFGIKDSFFINHAPAVVKCLFPPRD